MPQDDGDWCKPGEEYRTKEEGERQGYIRSSTGGKIISIITMKTRHSLG